MDISRLMVHALQVEDSCLRKKNRETKKARSLEISSSKSRLDVQDKPNSKKKFSNKGDHMVKDCPNVRRQDKGKGRTQPSGPISEAPKGNHFYALESMGEQERSPDIVTGMLQVFSVNVTLSFVAPLLATKFDVLPDVVIEPF
ncbi:uncharacterized protein LOC107030056 [Solanum pennellii]|uniref:Uncharacterized protein LOC107030056 n=1 Tax=Solanum pennellii TaxID=28526 RepID=A0ABM1HKV8_SOLPN|nr:uncharacterized protein LOC107030056 [Solanum pennellii]